MKIIFASLFLLLASHSFLAQSLPTNICSNVAISESIKYKVGFLSKEVGNPQNISLQISLRSNLFTEESMLKLVKRLRSDYCSANVISAVLFDNAELAKDPAKSFDVLIRSNPKQYLMRGFYHLNKTTGKEELEFSLKPGNPTTEVSIKFKGGQVVK